MAEPITPAAAIATLREWATIWAFPEDIAAAKAGADALERITALDAKGDTLPPSTVQDVNAATVLTIAAEAMGGTVPGEIIVMIRRGADALRERHHAQEQFRDLLQLAERCINPDGEDSTYTQASALHDLEAWLRQRERPNG